MQNLNHIKIEIVHFYPEEFRRKIDAEKYSAKGTCEVRLLLGPIELDIKNITYRINHEGKISLKPPFRVHSNKTAGIKPKLVPSVVFKEPSIWNQIEQTIKSELSKDVQALSKSKRDYFQLVFWEN